MRAMKYVVKSAVRTTVTLGAALALFTGLSASAHAAGGEFGYVNVNEDDFTLENPVNGECFLLLSGARKVENATNARASLFAERDCEGPSARVMRPGESAHFGSAAPHSVRFG
ncbi:hypothetical protein J7F03_37855 [Streptomyces sp. ISL-43]|uniref:hypothetical protein n=1 Tax=Streptomyces sp. ISL-43 TaxID=2819183 RepID=UPI001BE5F4FB|nr:hypothetical protein [Streptomyces sp. ISL-43]MBT2452709.1 hypothetical protein [Streptomyces sp. ISL-43]